MAKNNTFKTRFFYFLLVISGVLIFIPGKITNRMNISISELTNYVTKTPYSLASDANSALDDIVDATDPASELKDQYVAAQNEINNLRAEIAYQKQFIYELANIRTELSLGRAILVRTHISADDSSVSRNYKVLDRGSNDYIRPGLIALASSDENIISSIVDDVANEIAWKSAVVGRIVDVNPNSSSMQVINDPAFTVNVVIKPAFNRGLEFVTEGLLYTDGSGKIHIKHVETSSEVLPGDPVFLKASEHTLPVDVIIGYVAQCTYDPDNAVLWNIVVRPAKDLSDIKDVVVVCPATDE